MLLLDESVMYKSTHLKDEPLSRFHDYDPHHLRALISDYPLAWVTSRNNEYASLLPLIGVFDEAGTLTELIGHFALSNPLADAFRKCSQTTVFFNGPHGYISPSQAGRRNWGPTWNYAQAKISGDVIVDSALTPDAIERLVTHVEKDMANPWRSAELGPRYDLLMQYIVGFRVEVSEVSAVFKLGQTEDRPTLDAIIFNLPDGELKDWMIQFQVRENGKRGRHH